MRHLILIAVLCCAAGCAGTPTNTPADGTATAASQAAKEKAAQDTKVAKLIPERIKGPFKVIMRGEKKLYCTKELATGSHVNFRTICLTPEEYADLEARARDWTTQATRGVNSASGPLGTGPGQNP